MPIRDGRLDRAKRAARRALIAIGEDLREARIAAGLTQRQVGAAVGLSHSAISRIELGKSPNVGYETLVLVAAAVGLDLPLRSFPSGDPIRDAAQSGLLAGFRALLPAFVRWRAEVPLDIPGDRRAWDGLLIGDGWELAVEAETRLRDVQALMRKLNLKARDGHRDRILLVIADTRHNRRVVRLAADDLASLFPVRGRRALADLVAGRPPAASALLLVPVRSVTSP
jgi:transcriptional regulator with XRE-family HTH domain